VLERSRKHLLVLKAEKRFMVSSVTRLQIILKNHAMRKDLPGPCLTQLTFLGIKMPGGLVLTFNDGNLPCDPDLRSPLFVSDFFVVPLFPSFDPSPCRSPPRAPDAEARCRASRPASPESEGRFVQTSCLPRAFAVWDLGGFHKADFEKPVVV